MAQLPKGAPAAEKCMRWYDFHRHLPVEESALPWSVLSFSLFDFEKIPPGQPYSIALHPWDTERLDAVRLIEKKLPKLLAEPTCVALGECGLDRLRGASMPVQLELLEQQLVIAKAAHKPLVVHCVRAWGELAAQLRRSGFELPKAVHGFRGSVSVLKQLVAHDWYISVGLDANGRLPEATSAIPEDRILLETDASSVAIKSTYIALAKLKGITLEAAHGIVQRNIMLFFGGVAKFPSGR